MPVAADGCLKRLCRAELHACRRRCQAEDDITRDGHLCGGKYGCVRLARGANLHTCQRRQIRWGCIDAGGGDGPDAGIAARNAIHAPGDGGVRGARNLRGKCLRITEQQGCAGRRHAHRDRKGRWGRRGRYRACASPSAAQRPRTRREESGQHCRGREAPAMPWKGRRAARGSRRRASENCRIALASKLATLPTFHCGKGFFCVAVARAHSLAAQILMEVSSCGFPDSFRLCELHSETASTWRISISELRPATSMRR